MSKVASTLIALALAWAGAANAAPVIYDNGIATVIDGLKSDPGSPNPQFIADDFSLTPGLNVITDIHWTGWYSANTPTLATDNFTIRIFADAGGLPTNPPIPPLHTLSIIEPPVRTDTGLDVGGRFDLFAYSVDVAPIALASSTPFWLSIVNDTAADPNNDWLWGVGARAGESVAFFNGNPGAPGVWQSAGGRGVDFQLTGVVPLPPALPLFVAGLLTLFGLSWRRNQAV